MTANGRRTEQAGISAGQGGPPNPGDPGPEDVTRRLSPDRTTYVRSEITGRID